MALINGSIPVGATYSPTGGTARTIKFLGNIVNGIKAFIDDSPANAILRKVLYVTSRAATPDSNTTSGFTAEKRKIEIQVPFTNGSGEVEVDKVIVEFWYSVNSDATQRALCRGLAANLVLDSDSDDLILNGSTG